MALSVEAQEAVNRVLARLFLNNEHMLDSAKRAVAADNAAVAGACLREIEDTLNSIGKALLGAVDACERDERNYEDSPAGQALARNLSFSADRRANLRLVR